MKIAETGGEFRLIEQLTSGFKNHHQVPVTVGDDAAVVRSGDDFIVLTTDALVEGRHFNFAWASPLQVGRKTVEVNASDVAAMGAVPEFLLLSLIVPEDLPVETLVEVYRGIRERCDAHGITLLGGDTAAGPCLMLNAALTGRTSEPILRSTARPGDLLCVTGHLGGQAAALACLKKGLEAPEETLLRHLDPFCRLDAAPQIARFATAMIDVSDGLASEVRHICKESRVGAVVEEASLPITEATLKAADAAGLDAQACALASGEEFELLFAIAPTDEPELRERFADFTVVGVTEPAGTGAMLRKKSGEVVPLAGGWDHFGK